MWELKKLYSISRLKYIYASFAHTFTQDRCKPTQNWTVLWILLVICSTSDVSQPNFQIRFSFHCINKDCWLTQLMFGTFLYFAALAPYKYQVQMHPLLHQRRAFYLFWGHYGNAVSLKEQPLFHTWLSQPKTLLLLKNSHSDSSQAF